MFAAQVTFAAPASKSGPQSRPALDLGRVFVWSSERRRLGRQPGPETRRAALSSAGSCRERPRQGPDRL